MVSFVPRLQPTQNRDGVFDVGLANVNGLESTFERRILLDDLLTSAEVCRYFQIHRATLTRWHNAGRLVPIYLAERAPRWRGRDILAFVESCPTTRDEVAV